MTIELSSAEIRPGNGGRECPAQGGKRLRGEIIEIGCDECDYFLECFPEYEKQRT